MEPENTQAMQAVWSLLRKIYGKDLNAVTLVTMCIDENKFVTYRAITFPQSEPPKEEQR